MSDSRRSKFFANASPLSSPTKRLNEVNWDDESEHIFDNDSDLPSDLDDNEFEFDSLTGAPKVINFSPVKSSGKRTRIDDDDDDDNNLSDSDSICNVRPALSPIKSNSVYNQYLTTSTSVNDHVRRNMTAEMLERCVVSSVNDELIAQNQSSFQKITLFVSEFFSNRANFAATNSAFEAKKALFGANVSPVCVSFVVAHNNATDQEFILLGLSSPEVNRDLENSLRHAADSSVVSDTFKFQVVMSEPASKDYQKLILAVTEHIGAPVANYPARPCAEKAYFSSFIKLQQQEGSDLSVKMICNLKFLPQQVTAQNPSASTDFVFDVEGSQYKMAIIAPCPDCKKNMAATALVMAAARAGNQVLSPIKQNGIKRVLRGSAMFPPSLEQQPNTENNASSSCSSTARTRPRGGN